MQRAQMLLHGLASGARVAVIAEPLVLNELDQLLWSFSPSEFVPHALVSADSDHDLTLTPVLLIERLSACGHQDILVNLGQEVPAQFEGFERLIEVVADDQEAVLAGRQRWRHYATRGYTLKTHDRAGSGVSS